MKSIFRHFTQSRWCSFGVRGGFTLFAFWLVLRGVDFGGLQAMLKQQRTSLLLAVGVLMFFQAMLGGLRWRLILGVLTDSGHPVMPVVEAIRIYYISNFFNSCLPGTVGGDAVRVWLAKSDHMLLPVAIHSVIIDRLMALVALALMVMATLPLLGKAAGFDAAPLVPVMIVLAAAGIWLLFHVDRWLAPFQQRRVVRWLLYFIGNLRRLFVHRLPSAVCVLLALTGHLTYCVAAWVLAISLHIDFTLLQSIMMIPPVVLATTLPISIGGWGVREAGIVGMLAMAGVTQGAALILSLQLGLLALLINLPGGLLWLAHRRHCAPLPEGGIMAGGAAR